MIYADSSFAASLFACDGNTARALEIYNADRRRPLCFTAWQEIELNNTLRLGLHRDHKAKRSPRYSLGNCIKRIHADLQAGLLVRTPLHWESCLRRAEELSELYTEKLGCVMLDIMHVAAAIEVKADTFWTFDEYQEALARAVGRFKSVRGLKG